MLLSELPDELLQLIAASLDEAALSEAQLSCRGWRGAFGRAVLRLHPRQLPPQILPRRFPNLQSVDLSRCVGSLVTDAAVRSLSALTLLTALCLKGCSKVSSEAVRELQALAMLERLDLSGCKVRCCASLFPRGRARDLPGLEVQWEVFASAGCCIKFLASW